MKTLLTVFTGLSLLGITPLTVGEEADISSFTKLSQFDGLDKLCATDSDCQIVDTKYRLCGQYDSMVYSKKTISGAGEQKLHEIAEQARKSSFKLAVSENCALEAQPLQKAVCEQSLCQIEQFSLKARN